MKIVQHLCDAWEHKADNCQQLLLRLASICAKYFTCMLGMQEVFKIAVQKKILRSDLVQTGVIPIHYLREACSDEIADLRAKDKKDKSLETYY